MGPMIEPLYRPLCHPADMALVSQRLALAHVMGPHGCRIRSSSQLPSNKTQTTTKPWGSKWPNVGPIFTRSKYYLHTWSFRETRTTRLKTHDRSTIDYPNHHLGSCCIAVTALYRVFRQPTTKMVLAVEGTLLTRNFDNKSKRILQVDPMAPSCGPLFRNFLSPLKQHYEPPTKQGPVVQVHVKKAMRAHTA